MTQEHPSWWRRWFGQKSVTKRPTVVLAGMQRHSWRKWDFKTYVEEGYERNPYVYRAFNFIAGGIGSLNWQELRQGGDGNVDELKDSKLLELLRRPHPYFGGAAWFQLAALHLLIGGGFYAVKVGPGVQTGGKMWPGRGTPVERQPQNYTELLDWRKAVRSSSPPRELHLLSPDGVELIEGDATRPIAGFKYKAAPNKAAVTYDPEDVIYVRIANALDPLNPFPPLAAMARAVDEVNEVHTWNMSLLKNQATPPGMWSVGGAGEIMEEDDFQTIKRRINAETAGAKNAGTSPVFTGDVKYEKFAYSPAEMAYENLIKVGAREVALVCNMPPKLMFDSENQNYASLKEARKQAWTEAVLPLGNLINDELNNQLVPDFYPNDSTHSVGYDRDAIEELSEDRDSLWTRVNGSNCITVNEKRRALGYDEIEGGDVVLVTGNNLPLDAVSGEGPLTEE